MGCNCTKTGKLAYDALGEELVQTYETALGFSQFQSEVLLRSLSDYSQKGDLSLSSLNKWLQACSLPSSHITDTSSALHVFYSNFKEDRRFSTLRLSVLSVLLGSAPGKKKAGLLYALYDPSQVATITAMDAQLLVQEVCDIALVYVPQYAELQTAELSDKESVGKLRKYVGRLAGAYNNTFACLQKALVSDRATLTYEEFVETVTSRAEEVVSSLGTRELAASFPVKVLSLKQHADSTSSEGRKSVKPRKSSRKPTKKSTTSSPKPEVENSENRQ